MTQKISGLREWLLQRISAVYLAGFILYLVIHFLLHPNPDYEQWQGWIGQPHVSTAWAGFVLALIIHGWVGLRDVILDYIHHLGLRLLVLTLIALMLIGSGFWAMRILILASN